MPSYIFTVHGVPVEPDRPCTLEISFTADNDNSAIEHAVSNLSAIAKRQVQNCAYGKLFHSSRTVIGSIDLNSITWTPSDIDRNDHPIYAGNTINQLRAGLSAVNHRTNWKKPIDTTIPKTLAPDVVGAAIAFY